MDGVEDGESMASHVAMVQRFLDSGWMGAAKVPVQLSEDTVTVTYEQRRAGRSLSTSKRPPTVHPSEWWLQAGFAVAVYRRVTDREAALIVQHDGDITPSGSAATGAPGLEEVECDKCFKMIAVKCGKDPRKTLNGHKAKCKGDGVRS